MSGSLIHSEIVPLPADNATSAAKERQETDSVGRVWALKDWKETSLRPYPKNLREREAWYRKKWGEDWYGPTNGCRIHNPGEWKWDTVDTVPPDMAARIKVAGPSGENMWGKQYAISIFIWAPGGGQVTDIYVTSDNTFYHLSPDSRQRVFIGKPEEGGRVDGVNEDARLHPAKATLDPITGRIYFLQEKQVWRYVEKLLPYQCTLSQKICYLPSVLDWQNMYQKTKSPFGGELKPVFTNGIRGEPIFVVRSNPELNSVHLPGAWRGSRPLITPDGKGVYYSKSGAPSTSTKYDKTALFDIETGMMLENLKVNGTVPENFRDGTNGPGSHGGNNMGYDGKIYTAQHGGCCGPCGSGSGRMFSIDPTTGELTILYDSMPNDGTWKRGKSSISDGPADALSLRFTSTLWQTQCPRTGAIVNGGWDMTGIRRYHDGFVTSIVNAVKEPRPGWSIKESPLFEHRNCNPSIAPNGDLYIPDVKYKEPRIIRIYRTDWPKEQPVNGYAEKFLPKEKMALLMLEYAQRYIKNYAENNKLIEHR